MFNRIQDEEIKRKLKRQFPSNFSSFVSEILIEFLKLRAASNSNKKTHLIILFLIFTLQKIGCRLKIFSNIAPQSTDRIAQIIGKEDQCLECLIEITDLLKTVRL